MDKAANPTSSSDSINFMISDPDTKGILISLVCITNNKELS